MNLLFKKNQDTWHKSAYEIILEKKGGKKFKLLDFIQSYFIGDEVMYQSMMTLCRALAQYLLLLSKLPAALRVPPDKEDDILKFVVMSVEVRNYSIIKDVMKCWERERLLLKLIPIELLLIWTFLS